MRKAAWLVVVLAGCGGGDEKPGGAVAGVNEWAALTDVVAEFNYAYKEARVEDLCGLFTAAARERLVEQLRAADPELARLRTCEALLLEAYGDPSDQPDAIGQASAFEFRSITVDGERATVTFPSGSAWRLERVGGRWRIASAPLIPSSLRDQA